MDSSLTITEDIPQEEIYSYLFNKFGIEIGFEYCKDIAMTRVESAVEYIYSLLDKDYCEKTYYSVNRDNDFDLRLINLKRPIRLKLLFNGRWIIPEQLEEYRMKILFSL